MNFTFESVDGNGKERVITAPRNDSNGWDIEVTGSDGLTEYDFESIKEPLNKSKCADWRAYFSPDEGENRRNTLCISRF